MTDQVLREYRDIPDGHSSHESYKRRNDDLLQRVSTKEENAPPGLDRFSFTNSALLDSGMNIQLIDGIPEGTALS